MSRDGSLNVTFCVVVTAHRWWMTTCLARINVAASLGNPRLLCCIVVWWIDRLVRCGLLVKEIVVRPITATHRSEVVHLVRRNNTANCCHAWMLLINLKVPALPSISCVSIGWSSPLLISFCCCDVAFRSLMVRSHSSLALNLASPQLYDALDCLLPVALCQCKLLRLNAILLVKELIVILLWVQSFFLLVAVSKTVDDDLVHFYLLLIYDLSFDRLPRDYPDLLLLLSLIVLLDLSNAAHMSCVLSSSSTSWLGRSLIEHRTYERR